MADVKYTEFKDKVAIVTGAGLLPSGKPNIGYETAKILDANGARTIVVDINSEYGRNAVGNLSDNACFYKCDMGSAEEIKSMVDHVCSDYGVPYLFVNTTGIEKVGEDYFGMSESDLERIIDVNFRGAIYSTRHLVPRMAENGGGRVVLIGSAQELRTFGEASVYQPTKAATTNIVRNIAFRYGNRNVRAINIQPGAIASGVMGAARGGFDERSKMNIPMNRRGHPYEVANIVCVALSELASYANGASWLVDGGEIATGSPTQEFIQQENDPDE